MEGVEVLCPTPQEYYPQQVASNNSVKSDDYKNISSNLSQVNSSLIQKFFSAGDDCHRPLSQQARYLFFDTHRDNHQDRDQFDEEFYSHAIAYFTPDEEENQNCNQNQNQQQNELAQLIYDCICENSENDPQSLQRPINYDDFQAVIALEPNSEETNFQQNSVNIIYQSQSVITSFNDQPYTSQEIEDQSGISLLGNENNVSISLPISLTASIIEPSSIISLSNQLVSQNIDNSNSINHEIIFLQINRLNSMEQENNLIIKGIQQKFNNRHAEQSDREIQSYQCHIFIPNENSYHRGRIMEYLDNT